jgi:AcrR family transcriptional regulator
MHGREDRALAGQPSLRARKKSKTRELLVEAAARLFHERGFDAVTVSQIARAAEVSEQTVYNYFSTKEALVLDEDEAYTAYFAAVVRDRPAGISAVEAIRREALEFLQRVIDRPASPYRRGGMPYLVVNSPPLRRAWLAACERHAKAVAAVLALDSHGGLSQGAADIVAMSLLSVFRVIIDEVGAALTADGDLPARLSALRPQIEEGMGWLAGGLDGPNREPPA